MTSRGEGPGWAVREKAVSRTSPTALPGYRPAFHQRAPLGGQSHASLVGSATCLLVIEAVTLGHLELSGHRASADSAVQARGDEGRAGVYQLQEIHNWA